MTTGPLEAHVTYKCSTIKFSTKAVYPQSRCKHVSCIHEGHVYVFAGKDGNISLRDFWRFSLASQKWETVSFRGDTLQHLEGHTLVSCKKLLLLFGGEFGDALTESSLWIINPDLGYIRKSLLDAGSERPCIRRHHSAIVYNGAMYIYGGYIDMKGSSTELWRYQVDDEEWELMSPRQHKRDTPSGRHGHTAVVYGKHMWLYGGSTDLTAKQDLWSYSFGANKWERIKFKYGPPALSGHTATVIGTRMFTFGGETSREPCNQLWYFCFRTLKWSQIMLSDQIPSRTFHCAVFVTPSCLQENSVKASSVPYLQKKIAKLNLERPKSSPGVRQGSSRSNKSLQQSGSQESLFLEKSVSSRSRSVSLNNSVQGSASVLESDRPNILKFHRQQSEDGLKLAPSPSENTADRSPLCPKRIDINYNAIDMLNRNVVNGGIDNPAISDSTEELIRENYSENAKIEPDETSDKTRVSAFQRSLSYATECEKRKNLYNSSETLISVIGDSSDSLVIEGENRPDNIGVKKSRLDPDLVLEDLEYLDCFPHDVKIPFPNSTPYRFSSYKSAESLLQGSGNIELMELDDINCSNREVGKSSPNLKCLMDSVQFDKEKELVHFHCLKYNDNYNVSTSNKMLSESGTLSNKVKSNTKNGTSYQRETTVGDRKETISNEEETSFRSGDAIVTSQNTAGLYKKKSNMPKVPQTPESPYILIIGGKDNTSVNFGIKPLPLWKLQIHSL